MGGNPYGAPPPMGGPAAGFGAGNYSPWIKRVGASVVTALATSGITSVINNIGRNAGGILAVIGLLASIFGIITSIRSLIQRGHLGYTVGDRVLGQRLVRESTGAPMGSGWSVFWRAVAHLLDALPCFIGFLWPLWDSKRQTFADKVCGTVVVEDTAQHHDAKQLLINLFMFWTPVIKA
jgi:uncharacterized RDD family membrane protein YckC